jgi:hypothetical protein
MRRQVHALDGREYLFDLLRRRMAVHDDKHGDFSPNGFRSR